jgi:hypothetical protein
MGNGIYLAQDRDRWWALVNSAMNLWFLVLWSWLVSYHGNTVEGFCGLTVCITDSKTQCLLLWGGGPVAP